MMRWILLRGWTRESRHWEDFPRQLAQALPEAQLLALDLPGTGAAHAEVSPASVPGLVERCRRELLARDIAAPFSLLGLSLGAMVCMEWCARHPAEVERCVLINPSLATDPFHQRLQPSTYGTLLRTLLSRDPMRREARILERTANLARDPAIVERWARYASECPVTRANAARQLRAAASYDGPEEPPTVPILLLSSAADRLVDPRCSERLARRWNLAHAVHPAAGHDLTLDDGPWAADQIRRWITPS